MSRIQIATTGKVKPIYFEGYQIVFVPMKHFFGYKKVQIEEGELFIVENEKLIIDCLLYPKEFDFTTKNKIDITKCENDFKRFKLEYEIESKPFGSSISFIIRIKGPLHIGTKASLCRLIIDDSVRENVMLKPEIRTIGRFLEEIPTFDVIVMQ